MTYLKKLAVINDLSGLGKCSLTAAIPVISAMGVQAVPLPTAVLSNQTGYDSYYCDDYTDKMDDIMEEWEKRGFSSDGIYTGFMAGEAQTEKIFSFFQRFCKEDTLVLVDPVMGDQGKVYGIYSEGLCQQMRLLCGRAQVITPNLTEALLLLYGKEGMEEHFDSLKKIRGDAYLAEIEKIGKKLYEKFSLESAVITGIDFADGEKPLQIGNLVITGEKSDWTFAEKTGGSYSGTGDLFASVLSAGLVKGIPMEKCVEKAVDFLSASIRDAVEEGSDRNDGVCFETYLYKLWELNQRE